jgi:hypothetical protein
VSKTIVVTPAQRDAAKLRMLLDKKAGRETDDRVERIAQAVLAPAGPNGDRPEPPAR